jgi:hypothetical protein
MACNIRLTPRESPVLLEQSIVASCTAYECFLKEMIPWVLGHDEQCARRFLGSMGRPIKELGKYDFEPLPHVAAIYQDTFGKKLMPVFPDVVDFYRETLKIELFDDEDDQREVEEVFQIRHCIVHNAGKPDDQWRQKNPGKRFRMGRAAVWKYGHTVHSALHGASVAIYKALGLDEKLAPWSYEGEVLVCKLSEMEENGAVVSEELDHKPTRAPTRPSNRRRGRRG